MKIVLVLMIGIATLCGCTTTPGMPSGEPGAKPPVDPAETRLRAEALNRYLASIMHLKRGDFEDAITDLRTAADLDDTSTALQLRLLAFYYGEGDYENAALMAERALRVEPKSVMLRVWLGNIYMQMDRIDDSTAMLEEAIELDPNSTNAYEDLAKVEEQSNDLVGAVRVYRTMLERTPDSAALHYRLGVNLMEMDDAEGARAAFERAVELDPAELRARYVLGVVYMDLEQWDKAEDLILGFLKDNPDHAPSLENLASVYARTGQFDKSYTLLKTLIESADVEVRHHLHRSYIYLREPSLDSKYLGSAPNDAPLVGTVFQMLVRQQRGEPNETIARAIDSADGDLDFECSVYLGSLLSRFGTEDAGRFLAEQLESLLDAGLHSRVLLTMLGRTYLYAEQPEKALIALNEVIKRYGSDKWTHYYLATVYESLDDPAKAEEQLRKTLEFDPNDPDVLNFLGYLLADEDQRLSEAEELIERALLNDPENGFYLDSLGWVYYRQGKGALAVDHIKRAIRAMNSDDAILRDHLGDAYFLNGELEKALAEWERAQQLDPELEGVGEKIDRHRSNRRKRS